MSEFKPKYFSTSLEQFSKEVLPPDIYNKWGIQGLRKMNQDVLEFLDEFRFGCGVPLTVNSWSWGGNRTQSGLRDVNFYGSQDKMDASLSDHITGNALDIISSKLTAHELRAKFIEREDYYYETYGINFIEVGSLSDGSPMSWFHAGKRVDFYGEVKYWSPKKGYVTKEDVLKNKW